MNNLRKVLNDFNSNYPIMGIQDVLKLLYQSEFGCGHLIKEKSENYLRLIDEWNEVEASSDEALFEEIGDGYARFNIKAAKQLGVSIELFQKIFLKSAEIASGSINGFYEKVKVFIELCEENIFLFSAKEVKEFLCDWEIGGQPLFSHSQEYRKLYNPAYRVVTKKFIDLLPIFFKIENKISLSDKVIIGIDGRCGAGKTTLSDKLADFYDVEVIHMDDFFLPPALRSEERLSEPGGNIHYERFSKEVVKKIKSDDEVKYKVFSCRIMDYDGDVTINNKKLIIVEGSYSMHPLFNDIYNIRVFCDVETNEQKRRIINRNGFDMYKNFESKWIPMEELYFKVFNIKEKCDFVVI